MNSRKTCLVLLVVLLTVVGLPACRGTTPVPSLPADFNLIFRYGVGAKNELDTFAGTFTKDMIGDPSITIDLLLTEEELDRIYQKMAEVDFFAYPDEFSINVAPGEPVGMVTPHSSYYFRVEYNTEVKELRWEDRIVNEDGEADRLRALTRLIQDIIRARQEFQELPPPRGGYM